MMPTPVPLAERQPHNMILPPRAVRSGWCSLGYKPFPSSPIHNVDHYGQTVLFLSHLTREHSSKMYDINHNTHLQTFQVMTIQHSIY